MRRLLPFLVAALLIAACGSERHKSSVWTLNAVDAPCASSVEAKPALLEAWGKGASRIDGASCSLDEVLTIDEPNTTPGDSCCFPVTCTSALTPAEQLALFDATCSRSACGLYPEPTYFNIPDVTKRLAAKLTRCTLTGAPAATRTTQECTYRVYARYSCSSAPG